MIKIRFQNNIILKYKIENMKHCKHKGLLNNNKKLAMKKKWNRKN